MPSYRPPETLPERNMLWADRKVVLLPILLLASVVGSIIRYPYTQGLVKQRLGTFSFQESDISVDSVLQFFSSA